MNEPTFTPPRFIEITYANPNDGIVTALLAVGKIDIVTKNPGGRAEIMMRESSSRFVTEESYEDVREKILQTFVWIRDEML